MPSPVVPVVVAEGMDGPRRDAVRAAVRRLLSRQRQVDVLVPCTRQTSASPTRELVARGRARRVRVRDPYLEAAGRSSADLPRAMVWSRGAAGDLADVRSTPHDAVGLPGVLGERAAAGDAQPDIESWLFGTSRELVVRERVDPRGRAFQRDYLGPDGRVRVVAWLDLGDGAVTDVLVLDHGAGRVRRTRSHRWTARHLAGGTEPVPVVAATPWGDSVIDELPADWRSIAVRHGQALGRFSRWRSIRGASA